MLNLPPSVLDIIKTKENILIAGIGGGFDVFGGLPLYYTLKNRMGKNVYLANYSFTNFDSVLQWGEPEIITPELYGANSKIHVAPEYYPEGHLSAWFAKAANEETVIWMFKKTGVIPLRYSYQYLIDRFKIDLILLIDGGIDSLNTGLETGHGTILEDTISIAALSEISTEKIVVCIGFGTETEEKVCHYNVLMNMSNHIKNNGFYGSCSLVNQMNSYKYYRMACEYVFGQPGQTTSHIHRRIIPAIEGEFGNFHLTDEDPDVEVFISPLMSIYWFFNYQSIFLFNKVIPYVAETVTFFEAVQNAVPFIKKEKDIPGNIMPY